MIEGWNFLSIFPSLRSIINYKTSMVVGLLYSRFLAIFFYFSHFYLFSGVRPYKCNLCEKSFTQRCSLESHCLKVHGVAHNYEYKQRRSKVRIFSSIASIPINIRRIRTGSQPYWKSCIASYYIQFSTYIKMYNHTWY